MSKLEQLINELCPDGVEYKKLKDICNTITTGKLNANAMVENGQYPFFTCDKLPYKINNYSFDTEAILISGNGSQVGHINYYKGKFNAYQRTYVIYDFNNIIIVKYLLHYLKCNFKQYILYHAKKGSVPYITLPILSNFKIPLPPLPVQEEIVRILDTFTELTARKKQYEYYRDELLKFGDEVERVKLGDIAKIERGGSLQKKDFIEQGFPCIHYGQIYTKYSKFPNKTFTYISKEKAFKQKKANKNDIIMAVTSENIEDVCKCIAWCGENEVAVGGHTAIISHNQNPKYLTYYFNTQMFFKQKIKLAHGTKVIEVSPKKLNNIIIPLPPLSEQQRIVDILDRFDTLCNDITNGLPAEIEKRQKQYEYYRDKLLDFKELSK